MTVQSRSSAAVNEPDVSDARRTAAELVLDGVSHRFGSTLAVDNLSLRVAPGEMVAVLGPSGCGKSTLLRIVAGLLRPRPGRVLVDGIDVTALPPNLRRVGTVFQSYALFPHLTVADNVAYGLRAGGARRHATTKIVGEMLALVRMAGFEARYPAQLSGGQQQRVALARTLAVRPSILLLDEPFAALDRGLRLDMQIELKRLQRRLGISTLVVTHDQEEAMSLADRIVVLNKGRIEQVAAASEVYDAPASIFVAGFVGTTNLLRGRLEQDGAGLFRFEIADGALPLRRAHPCSVPGPAILSARPEQLHLAPIGSPGLVATVEVVLPLGATTMVEVALPDGSRLKISLPPAAHQAIPLAGEHVSIGLVPGAAPAVFVDTTNP